MKKLIKLLKNQFNIINKRLSYTKKHVYTIEKRSTSQKNIVFLLPNTKYASGGVIVAHHHSDKINELAYKGFQSEVLYPTEPDFSPDLFVHKSRLKRDLTFDTQNDFAMIPEVMVLQLAPELMRAHVKYGIHVQNGYLMDLEIRSGIGSYENLKEAYAIASLIIGNSVDTVANIITAFPECANKVIQSSFVIDKAKYQEIEKKQNFITYMPRKLEKHSKHLLFFLGDKLPKHWSIRAIDGVTEQEVYNIFYESKIFLSFSEFEGLAMPPAMAAMSGNRVIGYTGEANKEYFHLPCFEEVPCGDIKLFVSKILDAVARFDRNEELLDLNSIRYLQEMFSSKRQEIFLKELIDNVHQKLI